MFNRKRRKLLKSIGVAAAAVTATPIAGATAIVPVRAPAGLLNDGRGVDLSVVTEQTGGLSVTFCNHASTSTEIKHVYPGILQSKGKTFDINDMLANGPLTVGAGETVTVYMPKVATQCLERAIPQELTASRPLTVSTQYRIPNGEQSVSTLRNYFS